MIDRDPKQINPKDLGIEYGDEKGSIQPQLPQIPLVFRRNGQIRWALPGNSQEENKLLGIRNMQGLFLERYPDFLVRFPLSNDGRIVDSCREVARLYFIERIKDEQGIRSIFGGSFSSKACTPYFEGSKARAIQMSFAPLGIELDLIGRGNRQRIEISYQIDENGFRWVTLASLYRQLEIEYKTLYRHLDGVSSRVGKGMNGHEIVLYHELEARQRLEKFISQIDLPKAKKGTEGIIEIDGKRWVTLRGFRSRYGMQSDELQLILQSVPTTEAISSNKKKTTFYSELEAVECIEKYLSLPHIDSADGIYYDEKGTGWVSATFLGKELERSEKTIRGKLGQVATIEGTSGKSRKKVALYNLVEARRESAEVQNKLLEKDNLGRYFDEGGESWLPLSGIEILVGQLPNLKSSLEGLRFIEARRKGGKKTIFYNESEVRRRYQDRLVLPRVDKQTSRYIDENNKSWVPASYFTKKLEIGGTTLKPYLDGVAFQEGMAANGQRTILYSEHELSEKLKKLIELPRVDRETGKYTAENGDAWVAQSYAEQLGFNPSTILSRLSNIRTLNGRDCVNRETVLYNESDIVRELTALSGLPKIDLNTGIYTDEQQEEWVNLGWLVDFSKKDYLTVSRRLTTVRTIIGRGKTGRQTTLFDREESIAALADYLSSPEPNKETGVFTDETGRVWIGTSSLYRQFGLAHQTLYKILEGIPTINGKIHNKQVILYDQKLAMERLANILKTPKVNTESGLFTNESGEWANLEYILNLFQIGNKAVKRILRSNQVSLIIGRGKNGHPIQLYNLKEAQTVLGAFKDRQADIQDTTPSNDPLLQELKDLLHSGQIMSYEEFMDMKERQT